MIYSKEVEEMCPVAQGVHHGCAPIPEEAKWVKAKEVMYDPSIAKKVIEHWDEVLRSREDESNNCMSQMRDLLLK